VCSSNAECVKPAVCRNGVCQTVAVEAEANAVNPDPMVCEDQAAAVVKADANVCASSVLSLAKHKTVETP
jgi:predicted component of viral defense system (DUF524 family)